MTESEFLALAPRERDALVAEKVMGQGMVLHHEGYYFRPGNLLPDYTTISAAWTVVEKMREEELAFEVTWGWSHVEENNDYDNWVAGFSNEDERWTATADTAPLAICIAALRAKGVIE